MLEALESGITIGLFFLGIYLPIGITRAIKRAWQRENYGNCSKDQKPARTLPRPD